MLKKVQRLKSRPATMSASKEFDEFRHIFLPFRNISVDISSVKLHFSVLEMCCTCEELFRIRTDLALLWSQMDRFLLGLHTSDPLQRTSFD